MTRRTATASAAIAALVLVPAYLGEGRLAVVCFGLALVLAGAYGALTARPRRTPVRMAHPGTRRWFGGLGLAIPVGPIWASIFRYRR